MTAKVIHVRFGKHAWCYACGFAFRPRTKDQVICNDCQWISDFLRDAVKDGNEQAGADADWRPDGAA